MYPPSQSKRGTACRITFYGTQANGIFADQHSHTWRDLSSDTRPLSCSRCREKPSNDLPAGFAGQLDSQPSHQGFLGSQISRAGSP